MVQEGGIETMTAKAMALHWAEYAEDKSSDRFLVNAGDFTARIGLQMCV